MQKDTFLSCDWGTSQFRLRMIERDTLTVLAEIKTGQGVGGISREVPFAQRKAQFEAILVEHVVAIFEKCGLDAGICIISGMASSNIGWQELPYIEAPTPLRPPNMGTHTFQAQLAENRKLQILLVSGIRTENDIMRGEETELLGLLELLPELKTTNACVILPGTHSKHVRLRQGVLTGFTTYMTGELYGCLQGMPTLHVPLAGHSSFDEQEFLAGVDCVARAGLMASLFRIRARFVLNPTCALSGPSFLSGLLIGAELGDFDSKDGTAIYLYCSSSLATQYLLGAERRGLSLKSVSSESASMALVRAHHALLTEHFACN